MSGYIRLHRKLIDWEWFDRPRTLSVFIYLLLDANHQDASYHGRAVKRGQTITGLRTISVGTGVSFQSVRTEIANLVKTGEISQEVTPQGRVITICNYNEYNSDLPEANKRSTNDQQTTNKQLTNDQQLTKRTKEGLLKEKDKKEKIPTLQNLIEVEIPIVLRSLPGFCSLWEDWLKKKTSRTAKERWSDLKYCVQALALFERKHREGCDVLKTLTQGEERNWKGWMDGYFEQPGDSSSSTTNKGADWRRQEQNAATAARYKLKNPHDRETGGDSNLPTGSLLKLPQRLN